MKAQHNPVVVAVNLDDIVFANKNRDYGAYLLRKHYARHISFALFLSVLIFTVFSVSSIILNHTDPGKIGGKSVSVPIDIQIFTAVKDDAPKPVVRSVENTAALLKPMVKFMVPKLVDYDPSEDKSMPTTDQLLKALPGLENRQGDINGSDFIITSDVPKTSVNSTIVDNAPVRDEPITFAEVMPAYPGGESELLSFISQNVRYPEIAKKACVEGKVLIEFVVEKNGSLSNLHILKSIGAGCDEEALRVCRLMGLWHPGQQNGKAVRVKMVMPFLFRLQ